MTGVFRLFGTERAVAIWWGGVFGFVAGAALFAPLFFLTAGFVGGYQANPRLLKLNVGLVGLLLAGVAYAAQRALRRLGGRYPAFADFARAFVIVAPCPFLLSMALGLALT